MTAIAGGSEAGSDNAERPHHRHAPNPRERARPGETLAGGTGDGERAEALSALAQAGVLEGKTVTCYPGALDHLDNRPFEISGNAVESDNNIVTSRGPGTAMDFALELIAQLAGQELRDRIAAQMVR